MAKKKATKGLAPRSSTPRQPSNRPNKKTARVSNADPTQAPLIPDVDDFPAPLKTAAMKYKKACLDKAEVDNAKKVATQSLLDTMEETGFDSVRIEIDGNMVTLSRDVKEVITQKEQKKKKKKAKKDK